MDALRDISTVRAALLKVTRTSPPSYFLSALVYTILLNPVAARCLDLLDSETAASEQENVKLDFC